MIDHPNKLKKVLPSNQVKSLHKVITFKGLFSIALEWIMIIAAAMICEWYFTWWLYLITVIFIGARLLALGLIMHESVHNLISKNRKLNDVVSELFCAWPLFISMRSYRIKHLAHHRWLNTDQDPDFIAKTDKNWQFPMPLKRFVKLLIKQLSGLGIFETFRVMSSAQMEENKAKKPKWYTPIRILYYLLIIGIFIYFDHGRLLLLYWIIPFATYTQLANRLRRIAEHSAVEGKELPMQTRTTKHNLLTRFLLAPKHIAYHNEHHLYPGIPCYNLPKTHALLKQYQEIDQSFYVSDSYIAVFRDILIKRK